MTQALTKALALVVEGDAPGIAGALAEELEFARLRMDAEQGAGEVERPCRAA